MTRSSWSNGTGGTRRGGPVPVRVPVGALLRGDCHQLTPPSSSRPFTDSKEARGDGAVQRAVVPRHAQVGHRAGGERVAVLGLDDDGPLHDRLEVEDRDLGLVDDRRREHGPELPRVGDRERSAVDLVRLEPLRTRPLRQVGDRDGSALEAEPLRLTDHGDDQPVLERDGDPEVDIVVDDLLVLDRRVEDRVPCSAATVARATNAR